MWIATEYKRSDNDGGMKSLIVVFVLCVMEELLDLNSVR
jgi:hypothetical protein